MYSFAIIMWEMLTWQQPFEDMMSVQVIFSVGECVGRSRVGGGKGLI